jgi:hypothetical protein
MNGVGTESSLTKPVAENTLGEDSECEFTFFLRHEYEGNWITKDEEGWPDWVDFTVDISNSEYKVYLFSADSGITSDLDSVGIHDFQLTWVSVVKDHYEESEWGDSFEQSFTLTIVDSCVDD